MKKVSVCQHINEENGNICALPESAHGGVFGGLGHLFKPPRDNTLIDEFRAGFRGRATPNNGRVEGVDFEYNVYLQE